MKPGVNNINELARSIPSLQRLSRSISHVGIYNSLAICFLLLLCLVFSTCEMPERDNPWDEKASIDATSWSADGFQIQDVNLTSKKLSWTYEGDSRIEGFQIDRRIGTGEWQEKFYFAGKEEREWVDTSVVPDTIKTYTYRLTAVAGAKKSNERTGTVAVRFPGPTNFSIHTNPDTSFTLNWTYEATGHEGFKIDRKKNAESWQVAVGTVGSTQSSYVDKITSGSDYFYRLYAYYKELNSSAVSDSLIFPKLTTAATSSISSATAISGGNVSRGSAVSARGVVWSTSQNPMITLSTKTSDGSGVGSYLSSLSGLSPSTTYYVRAYATNSLGTAYGEEVSFSTTTTFNVPALTTMSVSSITSTTANSGGYIISDGGAAVTTRGVVWSTSQSPTIALSTKTTDSTGTGSFEISLIGLSPSTTYYVRAYATNSAGKGYGNEVIFSTTKDGEVYNPVTGKVWMDRNLGASRVATSSVDFQSYGDLYQWGRRRDGHEKRTSTITSTLSSSDTPAHGNFITVNSGDYDWRSPQNNNLWQGVNGSNNPCPGFRIPTIAEWQAELNTWGNKNSAGAFSSPLKLPVAGLRGSTHGTLGNVDSGGYYWSATVSGAYAHFLLFIASDASTSDLSRAYGASVRCIKDD